MDRGQPAVLGYQVLKGFPGLRLGAYTRTVLDKTEWWFNLQAFTCTHVIFLYVPMCDPPKTACTWVVQYTADSCSERMRFKWQNPKNVNPVNILPKKGLRHPQHRLLATQHLCEPFRSETSVSSSSGTLRPLTVGLPLEFFREPMTGWEEN